MHHIILLYHSNIFKNKFLQGFWCSNGVRKACPPGKYGTSLGLTNFKCDGPCFAGYYCPSSSTTPNQMTCGNVTVYCPEESGSPTRTDTGFYSHHGDVDLEFRDATDPKNKTMIGQRICEKGYYCTDGTKHQCPGGTFGWYEGAVSVDFCRPCEAGFFCPYRPGNPSTRPCGGPALFCPRGSEAPRNVGLGRYSIGRGEGDGAQQIDEKTCEPGHYCVLGIKHLCPARSYGDELGQYLATCSGFCPPGYECPQGSARPSKCVGITYSTGASEKCTKCLGIAENVPLLSNESLLSSISRPVTELLCHDARDCCDIFKIPTIA